MLTDSDGEAPVTSYAVSGAGPTAYERYLVPALFRPLAEATMPAVGSLTGKRVLDVACGTGIVARLASAQGATATGVDRNPGMLAVAREIAPQVTWIDADATALPLPDSAFDVAFCQQGLQFVPEPVSALRELRRVLIPGGQLAVALWCELSRAPGFGAFVDALARRGGTGLGDILRAPFGGSDADRVRRLIESAGFEGVHSTTTVVPARFPSVSAFFHQQVAASPLAEPVAALTTATRRRSSRISRRRSPTASTTTDSSFPWRVASSPRSPTTINGQGERGLPGGPAHRPRAGATCWCSCRSPPSAHSP